MYELQYGNLMFIVAGEIRNSLDPSDELAILLQEHEDGVILLNHGSAKAIDARYQTLLDALAGVGLDSNLSILKLPVKHLSQAMIDEINACLDCSGRVAQLSARLTDLSSKTLEKLQTP